MTESRDDATEQSRASLGDSLLRSVINLPQPKIKNPLGAGGLKAMQLPAVSLRGLAVVACLAALFGTTVVFILNAETRLLKEGSQSVQVCQLTLLIPRGRDRPGVHSHRRRSPAQPGCVFRRAVTGSDRRHRGPIGRG